MTLRLRPARVRAFRLARSGLVGTGAAGLAEAAACPASDFSRDAGLLALSARCEGLTRGAYEEAVDDGEPLVVGHSLRGAIHAVSSQDVALYGRALIATDEDELARQLGRQMQRLATEQGFLPTEALAQVSEALGEILGADRTLDKNGLHVALRELVDPKLMPWCEGCGGHHVAPMLWRYGTVAAGVRLDSERRYLLDAHREDRDAAEAVARFLRFYGPATPAGFGRWAGLATAHAKRLWSAIEDRLLGVEWEGGRAWVLEEDGGALEAPAEATGVRLIPPGDPYLQWSNRELVAPDAALRERLFRPVSSPGAVLRDGRLVGLWRIKGSGRVEVSVERLAAIARGALEPEVERLAALRGASEARLVIG